MLFDEDPQGGGIRAIRESTGEDVIQVEIPGSCNADDKCKVVTIDRRQCETFDFRLERGSNRVNLIWEVQGAIALSCRFGAGTLTADIAFGGCR